jgi:hypothetical protein
MLCDDDGCRECQRHHGAVGFTRMRALLSSTRGCVRTRRSHLTLRAAPPRAAAADDDKAQPPGQDAGVVHAPAEVVRRLAGGVRQRARLCSAAGALRAARLR